MPQTDNLNDIISSLSDKDIEMLKGVAQSVLGDNATGPKPAEAPLPSPGGPGIEQGDLDMIIKAKSLLDKMNKSHSRNTDLIMALKPYLKPEKQARADSAVRLMRLMELLPYFREMF